MARIDAIDYACDHRGDEILMDEGVPLSYEQLSAGMEVLALIDSCCQHSLLAMGGMTALSYRRGCISDDQLRRLAKRLSIIRQHNQCFCRGGTGQHSCAACQPSRLN